MKTIESVRMYKILGSDGNEYESLSAEKIRQWIRENRVEKKTPVMPEGAVDWVFLGDLPEFAGLFADGKKQGKAGLERRWRQLIIILVLLAAAIVAGVLLFHGKMRHH